MRFVVEDVEKLLLMVEVMEVSTPSGLEAGAVSGVAEHDEANMLVPDPETVTDLGIAGRKLSRKGFCEYLSIANSVLEDMIDCNDTELANLGLFVK
jgi:hypothetical protein